MTRLLSLLLLLIALSCQAIEFYPFEYNYIGRKYGLMDENGNTIIKPTLQDALVSPNGIALIQENNSWRFLSPTGLLSKKYRVAGHFSEGLAFVSDKGGKYYIDENFIPVIVPTGKDVYFSSGTPFCNGHALVEAAFRGEDERICFESRIYDTKGEYVTIPQEFAAASDATFNSGLIVVKNKQTGLWGYVNLKGEVIIPAQYDSATPFCNGKACVSIKKKQYVIDTEGNYIEKIPKYYNIPYYYKMHIVSPAPDAEPRSAPTPSKFLGFTSTYDWERSSDGRPGTFFRYLLEQEIMPPIAPSKQEIDNRIRANVANWEKRGEFETTAERDARVNDESRLSQARKELQAIQDEYDAQVAQYRKDVAKAKKLYDKESEKAYADMDREERWKIISNRFNIGTYDADNQSFLLSHSYLGDIILPVPRTEAQAFKEASKHLGYDSQEKYFIDNRSSSYDIEFAPTREGPKLKSITFKPHGLGKAYTYDTSTAAEYSLMDNDRVFVPVQLASTEVEALEFEQVAVVTGKTVGTAAATKPKPRQPSDVDSNIPAGKAAPNTYAIVVANEHYRHASDVTFGLADGEAVRQYLEKAFGLPTNHIYYYADASYGDMMSAIKQIEMISEANGGKGFNIIFYYVGHGRPDDASRDARLLPVDSDPRTEQVAIAVSDLYDRLGSSGADKVTVLLDACFSGVDRTGHSLANNRGVALKPRAAKVADNTVVLSAAQNVETAWPWEAKGHGMFTYWLLKKIQACGATVALGELADYVTENVKRTSFEENGQLQTPAVGFAPGAAWRTRTITR